MSRPILCVILLMAAASTHAQTPIPRQGDSCPTGTYKSGDYCKPDKEAIPREKGDKCPSGWYKSGGYCVKYGD